MNKNYLEINYLEIEYPKINNQNYNNIIANPNNQKHIKEYLLKTLHEFAKLLVQNFCHNIIKDTLNIKKLELENNQNNSPSSQSFFPLIINQLMIKQKDKQIQDKLNDIRNQCIKFFQDNPQTCNSLFYNNETKQYTSDDEIRKTFDSLNIKSIEDIVLSFPKMENINIDICKNYFNLLKDIFLFSLQEHTENKDQESITEYTKIINSFKNNKKEFDFEQSEFGKDIISRLNNNTQKQQPQNNNNYQNNQLNQQKTSFIQLNIHQSSNYELTLDDLKKYLIIHKQKTHTPSVNLSNNIRLMLS
jgi:hypothetical protein